MLMYILFSVCVLLLIVKYYKNSNYNYWKKRGVIEEYGILRKFIKGNGALGEVYKAVYDKYPHEPYVGIYLGSKPALLIRDLENVKSVLASDFQSFHSRGIVTNPDDVLADNLLFINDYKKWKLLRQKMSPVFTTFRIKTMFYLIERCGRDFLTFVEKDKKIRENPFKALYTYTTASLAASVFGIDAQTDSTMESPFLNMIWKTTLPTLKSKFKFFMSNSFPKLFLLFNMKTFGEFENFFVGAVKNVLKSRCDEKEKRYDFIETCISLQEAGVLQDLQTGYTLQPTDELMAAQAFFFFLAGADTSANTMHFTLIELAHNPHILLKVHNEIDQVFKECEGKVTFEGIEKLKYLECVVNEAMRKYPPIGSLQRKCSQETTLPVGNVTVEKDIIVVIPVYGIHRDEKYYPNPEIFDPDRFLSDDGEGEKNKMSYLAFGEGNRYCLGARYARLQVKVGLAELLHRFTLRAQGETPKKFESSFFALRETTKQYYDLVFRQNSQD